ncbi:MAG: transketolase [Succinivibrionaceae bacterium]|nr:transketolase [Succinivibrionaceae bacterium]
MLTCKDYANAIRALSMDAIQKANSGHPGAPMGMADIAEVLWRHFLNHNPQDPKWVNRDRFVLSNGHGSMLLYSLLHLTGYNLSIEDLKNFRQLHSKTPGHPEYGYADGVETTTGPLGQGITNAVGMALAEKVLAAQFNKPGLDIVDHYTYVFMGDGCLMEGVSHEACSLAGTLKLGKLIAFWDDNGISIDGNTKGWFAEDTAARFQAYGWHVQKVDGHDSEAITKAIKEAQKVIDKPSIICCKTIIGFGSPNKQGTQNCHGSPLGDAEIQLAKEKLNWKYGPFEVPSEIYDGWNAKEEGAKKEAAWNELFAKYAQAYPELAEEFTRRVNHVLPKNWEKESAEFIEKLQANPAKIASRKASQNALDAYGAILPEFLGGSADLAPSNLTMHKNSKSITPDDASGNYIHYGVREFGMSAIMNGIYLHGGFIPYGATFLMFMEYAKNAVRMSGLMKLPIIYVFTHDSIGLGEDGPTHQPIEQISSLRLTPNVNTWRPCDQVESAIAWKFAIESKETPNALIFSRQNLAQMDRTKEQLANVTKGAYVLKKAPNPDLIIIATGSEVELAMNTALELEKEGKKVQVVSMPCSEVFDKQPKEYKEEVLPSACQRRMAIEAGVTDFWYKYVGLNGVVLGIDRFGESAPANQLFELFGFTTENAVKMAKSLF